jgi:hypothetical protein
MLMEKVDVRCSRITPKADMDQVATPFQFPITIAQ